MNASAKDIQNVEPAGNPARLLELAVQQNLDVDKLERLMELQERWQAKQAKQAYNRALAKFQSVCPSMKRTKEIKHGERVIATYASLDEIRKTIQPHLETCDLTATFEIEPGEEIIRVGCRVAHVDGHSETTWMSAGADISGAKNAVQARGSTVTYLQRYSLIAALGITSADTDDDGQSSGGPVVENILRHNRALADCLQSVLVIKDGIATNDLDSAAEAWFELDNEVKKDLWLAPTKGGIFSTDERTIIHSSEFRKAYYPDGEG